MGKLGIYLLANHPTRERFIEAVAVCDRLGVDFLEVGFPFSDPVADGDLLERASYEALRHFDLTDCCEALKEAMRQFKGRIYVMTYANVLYGTGMEKFARMVGPVTGIILADVPLREISLFEKPLAKQGINLVRFLTPESRTGDINYAPKGSKDFIYFVSKRGTTGGDFALDDETIDKIKKARGKGSDVHIGFGIKNRKDVELAFKSADGAIVGTRAVEALEEGIGEFEALVRSLMG